MSAHPDYWKHVFTSLPPVPLSVKIDWPSVFSQQQFFAFNHKPVIERILRRRDEQLRRCLGHWVSGLNPIIIMNPSGFVGLGFENDPEARIIVPAEMVT
jgi:hypothetical protein